LFGTGRSGQPASRPLLEPGAAPAAGGAIDGSFHTIDGIPHFLSSTAAAHLLRLAHSFELVWASGWEEKASEYLPHLLGLPAALPERRLALGGLVLGDLELGQFLHEPGVGAAGADLLQRGQVGVVLLSVATAEAFAVGQAELRGDLVLVEQPDLVDRARQRLG